MEEEKGNVIVAGEPMSKDELAYASERVKGKKSPFDPKTIIKDGKKVYVPGTPVKAAQTTGTYKRSDGVDVRKVGNFIGSPEVGDSQTLKKFKRIMPNFNKPVMITRGIGEDAEQIHCKWIPMSKEEALMYQGVVREVINGVMNVKIDRTKAILLGYDEDHQMGLLEVGSIEENQEEI